MSAAPALAAVTVGGWFAYSALTGKSLGGVFTGASKQDPAGTLNPATVLTSSSPQDGGGGGGDESGMIAEMNRMIGLHQPYKWGGGHAAFDPTGPWDCSGAMSQLAHHTGWAISHPMTSTGFMTWGESGRGSVVTIFANPTHVFARVERGQYAGQCWGTTSRIPSQGGSLAWHDHTTVGFIARHPNGW